MSGIMARRRVGAHRTGGGGGGGGGITGTTIVYDAQSITGKVNGDPITQLLDQSGNGNHTTAVYDVGTSPSYSTTGWGGGLPSIRLPGFTSFKIPYLNTYTEAEVFIVVKVDSESPGPGLNATILWQLGHGFGQTHYPYTSGDILDHFGSSTRYTVGNPTPSLTTACLYNVVTTSSEWTARLNTSVMFTTGTNTVDFPVSPADNSLGGAPFSGAGGYGIFGYLAEFRLYPIKRTAPERAAIEAALKTKWNLTGY